MVAYFHTVLMIGAISCFSSQINAENCLYDGIKYLKEGSYDINFHTHWLCMKSFVYITSNATMNDIILIGSKVQINCQDSYLKLLDESGKSYDYCENGSNRDFMFFSSNSSWIEIHKKGNVILTLTVQVLKIPGLETTTVNPEMNTTLPSTYNPYTTSIASTISTPAPFNSFCGRSAVKPYQDSYKIVGGLTAIKNSWPWQAAIYDGRTFCGATLISDRWLVTAAHCNMYLDTLRVKFGEHDLKKEGDSIAIIKAEKLIKNPNYNNPYNEFQMDWDIALVKLSMPLIYTSSISPVCMPSGRRPKVGDEGVVTGWGKLETNSTKLSQYLQQTTVTLLNRTVCGPELTDRQICAGKFNSNIHSACKGDSGGPLVFKEISTNQYYLAGVVSGGRDQCDGRTFYTDVESMEEWIKQTIENN